MTVEQQLKSHALKAPDRVALIAGDIRVSYGELWKRCTAAAITLRDKLNLSTGDRVILSGAGSPEFVYAYFGVHIAGGIAVPIDPDTNQARLEHIIESTEPKAILGNLKCRPTGAFPFSEILAEGFETQQFNGELPAPSAIADILFTTGTTGAPKGVTLSYLNEEAAARQINQFIGNSADDIELLALPLSHSFGLGRMRCVLSAGGTLVLLGSFANIKRFFREMGTHGVTGFGMVPAAWAYIKKFSGRRIAEFSRQLKYVEIGSSFMSTEDKKLLMELLPDTRLCMHYGLTEASRSAFMEFHSAGDALDSAGKASPGVDIRVFDCDGNEAPQGAEGELCVKGQHVCSGYWCENAERFAADFFNGYFRTGDCATIDFEGNIRLKSRIKEMINVGGKKVSPMEVEEMINSIPGVKDCACTSIPDPDGVMGELVKAFVVADVSVTDNVIMDSLRPVLESYKLPAEIERISIIPRTASGKIQRLKLKNRNE